MAVYSVAMETFIRYELQHKGPSAQYWNTLASEENAPEEEAVEFLQRERLKYCKRYVKEHGRSCRSKFRVVMLTGGVLE